MARDTGVFHRSVKPVDVPLEQGKSRLPEDENFLLPYQKPHCPIAFLVVLSRSNPSRRECQTAMSDEEILAEEFEPAELEKELWPVPPDDIKEFEEELMDLDLRF